MTSVVIALPNRDVSDVYRCDDGRVAVEIGYSAVIYFTPADLTKIAPFIPKEDQQ